MKLVHCSALRAKMHTTTISFLTSGAVTATHCSATLFSCSLDWIFAPFLPMHPQLFLHRSTWPAPSCNLRRGNTARKGRPDFCETVQVRNALGVVFLLPPTTFERFLQSNAPDIPMRHPAICSCPTSTPAHEFALSLRKSECKEVYEWHGNQMSTKRVLNHTAVPYQRRGLLLFSKKNGANRTCERATSGECTGIV